MHNYIKKLLDGEPVEWKTLGEVCIISTGQSVNKQLISDNPGEFPVINSGREPLGFIDRWNTENDPIGITSRGAGVGSITWQEGKYFRGNLNYSVTIRENQSITVNFIYHLLQELQPEIKKLCTFDGIPALNAENLKKLKIPIPPLFVQQRIAEILDKFSELEKELEKELELRKKQYAYYRDNLLSFKDLNGGGNSLIIKQLRFKTLGEICDLQRGRRLTKRDLVENGEFPVYHGGIEPIGFYHQKNREANSVMVINVGASAGTIGYSDTDFWSSDGCFCFSHNEFVSQRFLFYSLQNIENLIKSKVRKAGIPTLDNKVLEKIKIPIPPMEEQERIVKILDKFDVLTNSISEGLPREIALRRKQYEYYREQLLTF